MAATSSFAISPSTSVITGTVDQGTANTPTNGWPVKVTDGTNVTAVKPASTAAVATDPAAVVALSPNSPLPAGGNAIGSVSVSNFPGTQPVSGTVAVSNFPATQPVSGTVAVSNFPGTQPISGTVTANQGTANTIANAWPTKITDGTNTAAVTAASAVKVDGSAVTQPISGTVTANQGGSWTATVTQSSGANLHVDVDNFPATQPVSGTVNVGNFPAVQTVNVNNFPATQTIAGTVAVSNFPATQPISAVSLPLPTGAATSALQTSQINAIQASYNSYLQAQQVVTLESLFTYSFVSAIDSTFFTNASASGATATVANGMALLQSGTNAAGSAWIYSSIAPLYLGETYHIFSAYIICGDAGSGGSYKTWGAQTTLNNGYYFASNQTTFQVVSNLNGVGTAVNAASFNIQTFTLDTAMHHYQIMWNSISATFIIDGIPRHTMTGTTTPLVAIPSLGTMFINNNFGGSTTNRSFSVLNPVIERLGTPVGAPVVITITTAITDVLKSGPGILRGITIGIHGTSSGTLTLYDNTAGSGKILASVDLTATELSLAGRGYVDLPFITGLTAVTTGATISVTISVE